MVDLRLQEERNADTFSGVTGLSAERGTYCLLLCLFRCDRRMKQQPI